MSYIGTQVDANDPSVPQWYKAGFGSEAEYNAVYKPAAAPGAAPLTSEQQSAKAILNDYLQQWGLGSLASKAGGPWDQFLQGHPMEQIVADIRKTDEYKTRFPYMQALINKGRAISESQAIDMERQYSQVLRSYGAPAGFYDQPSDFAAWIGGERSPAEIQAALDVARQEAGDLLSNPENSDSLRQLTRLYGVAPRIGDLTAYVLDGKRALSVLQRQFDAARAAGASERVGFGEISQAEAERLAALGITVDQAAQGFGQLVGNKSLFTALPGQSDPGVNRDQQLGAVFGGDVAAQKAIEAERARRVAAFGGGGGPAATGAGVIGLGSANS